MRALRPTLIPALALAIAACASGTRTIYVDRTPAPPPPRPVETLPPAPVVAAEPLEVTLGRPVRGQLVVQTNRPAYVAIFEIVPERGVTMIQPSTPQRRRVLTSGVGAVPVWWTMARARNEAQPARYVYAVASDQPLRISDQAFQPGYFERALGVHAARSASPYVTMRALARVVVPRVSEEAWGEDALTIAAIPAGRPAPVPQVVRVYCPGGSVHEVPVELADRAVCPARPRVATGGPSAHPASSRPDSILANNGRRVRPNVPRGRGPIDRVVEPVQAGNAGRGPQQNVAERANPGQGNGVKPGSGEPFYGAHAAPRADDRKDERKDAKAEVKEERKEAKEERKDERREAQDARKDARQDGREVKQEVQQEQKARNQEQKQEKPEQKPEVKEERGPERQAEAPKKAEQESRTKVEPKPEAKPKAEEQGEAKADDKAANADDKAPKADEKAAKSDKSEKADTAEKEEAADKRGSLSSMRPQ